MKIAATIFVVLAAMPLICSCSSKSVKQTKAPAKAQPTAAAVSEENAVIPDGDYIELTEDAEENFDIVTNAADALFPDVNGKKMYGFTGLSDVNTPDGEKSCYVFEFYTYKSKSDEYNKIATLAKDSGSDEIFVLNEENGEYETAEIPEGEPKWYQQATASISVNTSDIVNTDDLEIKDAE